MSANLREILRFAQNDKILEGFFRSLFSRDNQRPENCGFSP
jgi:hypothetical protein